MKVSKAVSCPVDRLCGYVNDREAFVILQRLAESKSRRFSELMDDVGKTSSRTLTKRLRELEACGMITRKVYREAPPRVEYSLTPSGRAFKKVLHAMASWSRTYLPRKKAVAA
ncbi:MAG: helix-turn-helix domain-containing protein [Patescibacteria group bacterium]